MSENRDYAITAALGGGGISDDRLLRKEFRTAGQCQRSRTASSTSST